MRQLALLIPIMSLIVACGEAGMSVDAASGAREGSAAAAAEVSVCTCATEPITSSARAQACAALMDSMSLQESVEATMACREQPPPGGPDLCFCVQTSSRDPDIVQACEAIIPQDLNRPQLAALILDCSRKRN